MGEKEMMVSTPLPMEYVEEDKEALETSFQALEIVGTTSVEAKGGDLKLSKATIMAAKINNATLTPDDAGKSSRQDEKEETEGEALKELERLLEQERSKLQFGVEELEVINLGEGEETREIRIGKLIPPNLKQGLTKLLREYEDIFAWSYQDMPGLDTAIVEHKLPLIPNAI
ncbi:hypothetical protein CR513_05669, partial [Mucuna pruriens]